MKNFNSIKNSLLLIACFVFLTNSALAVNTVQVKAVVSVSYESKDFFSSKPPKGTEARAIKLAKTTAWKKYISGFGEAKRVSYDIVKNSILARLDEFIIGYRVLDKIVDKNSKVMKVAVRVEINDAAVQSKINQVTAKGVESNVGFTWVFVTRAQDSVKIYQDRITNMSKNERGGSTVEKTNVSDSSIAMSDKTSSTSKRSTGGSTVKQSEKIKWKILSSSGLNTKMNEVMVNAGYEASSYGDVYYEYTEDDKECGVGKTIEEIRDEFVTEVDLSSKTKSRIYRTAKKCDYKYVAIGAIDVMGENRDSTSGDMKVTVSVVAQVYDVSRRGSKVVASIGPVQFSGQGEEATTARKNALSKSAKKVATGIVNQLRARGNR